MTGPAGSAEYLRNLLVGHIPVQLACAMAGLRLADLLADGPMTVDELSAAAKARPDLLRRLVRGLADIGLVTLEDDDRVSATEMGALLRSATAGSMRDLALYRGGPSYTSWGELERCVAIGGNFFDSVPVGYDLHILKWILHDWNDASCRQLLAQCRAALPADGRLLVVELLLPDGAAADGRLRPAIQTDLFMLVNFADSRERSLDEYERLLGDCGFALEQAIALPSSFSVLDFRPH